MIFCGDIALPFAGGVNICGLSKELSSEVWVGNLEGSLIDTTLPQYQSMLMFDQVFNDYAAIKELKEQINFACFNLANNHVIDVADTKDSVSLLHGLNVHWLGAGNDIEEANREIYLKDEDQEYVLAAFGWDGISCIYATRQLQGVNPYTKKNVLETAERLLTQYNGRRVILLFHWNYELECMPQPLDRELSHRLIDMGIYAIIGCHAHRVQPIEIYKGHPIVYGLGNFAFRQHTYMNGRNKFPAFSYDEIAFEIKGNDFYIHNFKYNPVDNVIKYINKCDIEQAVFALMNTVEYISYFKQHREQRKLLPVFYYNDSEFCYKYKIKFIKNRQAIVNAISQNSKVKKFIKKFWGCRR